MIKAGVDIVAHGLSQQIEGQSLPVSVSFSVTLSFKSMNKYFFKMIKADIS